MKEFIDKLIERLEEERKFLENTYLLSKKSYEVKKDAVARINELGGAIEIINELAEEYKDKSNNTFETIYDKVCSLEKKYANDGNVESVNDCIKLENLLQYFKEELHTEEYKVSEMPIGWIACSERLPNKEEYLKDDGRFIVTDGNRRYQSVFDIYSQVFRTPVFGAFGSYRYEKDKCVIAWQPLPAPFKEGE